jgi:hypothetical protein
MESRVSLRRSGTTASQEPVSPSDALEPPLDALRRRGQLGRDQRLLSFDPQLPRFAAGSARALLVLH